jgi:HEAT repeat protein
LILGLSAVGLVVVGSVIGVVLWAVSSSKDDTTPSVATTFTVSGEQGVLPKIVGPAPPPPQANLGARPPEEAPQDFKPPEPPSKPTPRNAGLASGAKGPEVYNHVLKSTAWVLVPMIGPQGIGTSSGSGSLIDGVNRLVLTNYHVVRDSDQVVVFFPIYRLGKPVSNPEQYIKLMQEKKEDLPKGRVVARDRRRDLALVQIDKIPEGILALPVAGQAVDVGQDVFSLGNPRPGGGGALWVFTQGRVRTLVQKDKWMAGGEGLLLNLEADVVLTDSATNHGDSGGPLVNDGGELVGVTQGGLADAQLLSRFIDRSEVVSFVETYCKNNNITWARETRTVTVRNTGQLPELVKNLKDEDGKVRAEAAQALGNMGPGAKIAVSALIKALKDSDDLTRRLAAEALEKIGPPDKTDVALLIGSLKDSGEPVRLYAASALGKLGPDARPAEEALREALKDREVSVRAQAARSLGKLGPDAKEKGWPALLEALKDEDRTVRGAAAEGLSGLGPLNGTDVPAVLALLKHPDVEVRIHAIKALGSCAAQAKMIVPVLLETAGPGADARMRLAVAASLGQLGPEAKAGVPIMAGALAEADKPTRMAILTGLRKLGPAAKDTIPKLTDLLQDKDKDTRLQILAILADLGKDAQPTISTVIGVFEEDDKQLRAAAVNVLGKIGRPAVPALIKALDNINATVRVGAAESLGSMGREASQAIRPLAAHSSDPNPQVRTAIVNAVQKIQAPR